jgi:Flp pilus assembly protein TadG
MKRQLKSSTVLKDRSGMAAVEFALIAPAMIIMFMGILEMSARYRASEEATRYVNQVADLISREDTLTTTMLEDILAASVHMMSPLDTVSRLDLDVSSIGYDDPTNTNTPVPELYWRRVAGDAVPFAVSDANGLGDEGDSVIRVGIRYDYSSPISSLFGGPDIAMVRQAYARPRLVRQIPIDGDIDDGGGTVPFFDDVVLQDDDHDNGHGNDDDHDDDSNPGQGGGNNGTGNNGNGNGGNTDSGNSGNGNSGNSGNGNSGNSGGGNSGGGNSGGGNSGNSGNGNSAQTATVEPPSPVATSDATASDATASDSDDSDAADSETSGKDKSSKDKDKSAKDASDKGASGKGK